MSVRVQLEERYWYPDDGGIVWVAGYHPVDDGGSFIGRDDPRPRGNDRRLLGFRVGCNNVDHVAGLQQGSLPRVGKFQRRNNMARCNGAAGRCRGQQCHHLVCCNGRRQRLADKIIWIGHHPFRRSCRGNAVDAEI